MDQYEYIRSAHRVYNKAIREIARETGHDRKTIKKALRGVYPKYSTRQTQPYPVLGPYLEIIDSWLEADKDAPKKQRHTAVRIFRRLVNEHGYAGCEVAVRRYVREAKLRLGLNLIKAFIPCVAEIDGEAEVDWGTASIYLDGEPVKVKVFSMRSKYSGRLFVRAYPCERQQAFFDAHMRAFEFFGGVFRTIIYDNLTVAVAKILKGKDRREQREFSKFHAYYSFAPRFCNPASGHEKGGVEGAVGFSRRNFLVPIPRVESFEALNEHLLKESLAYGDHRLAGRDLTVGELFAQEKSALLVLPEDLFSNLQTVDSRVSSYATVRVDANRYSVPTRHAGVKAQVLLYVDKIEVCHGGKRIAVHARLFGKNKWQLDPAHYLELLKQRPGAFESARPIRFWRPRWPEVFERYLARLRESLGESAGIKQFVEMLMLVGEYDQDAVGVAVESALASGACSIDAIRQILLRRDQLPTPEPLADWSTGPPANISVYGQLGVLT